MNREICIYCSRFFIIIIVIILLPVQGASQKLYESNVKYKKNLLFA